MKKKDFVFSDSSQQEKFDKSFEALWEICNEDKEMVIWVTVSILCGFLRNDVMSLKLNLKEAKKIKDSLVKDIYNYMTTDLLGYCQDGGSH